MPLCSLCHKVSIRRPCARDSPACASCCRCNDGGCVHHAKRPRDAESVGDSQPADEAPQQDPPQRGPPPPQPFAEQQQQQRQQQQQQPDLVALFRGLQESMASMQQFMIGAITSALRPIGSSPAASQPPPAVGAAGLGPGSAVLPPSSHLDAFPLSSSAAASTVSSAAAELRSSDQSPLKATTAPTTATALSAALHAWLDSGNFSSAQHRPWDEYIRQTIEYAHLTSTELALEYHISAMRRFKANPRTYDPVLHGPVDYASYTCVLHSAVAGAKERPWKRSRPYQAKGDRSASPPPFTAKRRSMAKGHGSLDGTSHYERGQRHHCEHHGRLVFHTSDECNLKGKTAKKVRAETAS